MPKSTLMRGSSSFSFHSSDSDTSSGESFHDSSDSEQKGKSSTLSSTRRRREESETEDGADEEKLIGPRATNNFVRKAQGQKRRHKKWIMRNVGDATPAASTPPQPRSSGSGCWVGLLIGVILLAGAAFAAWYFVLRSGSPGHHFLTGNSTSPSSGISQTSSGSPVSPAAASTSAMSSISQQKVSITATATGVQLTPTANSTTNKNASSESALANSTASKPLSVTPLTDPKLSNLSMTNSTSKTTPKSGAEDGTVGTNGVTQLIHGLASR